MIRPKKLYSTTEAAKLLGMKLSAFHRAVRLKRLKTSRIGWFYVVKGSDLIAYKKEYQ